MIRDPEVVMIMMSNRNGTKDVTWGKASCKGYRTKGWELGRASMPMWPGISTAYRRILLRMIKNDKSLIEF